MLVAGLEAEVATDVDAHRAERDEDDHALVVRNGTGRTRRVTVASGTIAVNATRVNDRRLCADGQRCKFTSRRVSERLGHAAIGITSTRTRTFCRISKPRPPRSSRRC
jgi:hypothetical protein